MSIERPGRLIGLRRDLVGERDRRDGRGRRRLGQPPGGERAVELLRLEHVAQRLADRPFPVARIAVEVLVGERQKQPVERPARDRCRGAALPARRGYDARWHERGDDPGLRLLEQLEEPVEAVADVDLRRRARPRPGGLEPVVRHPQQPAPGVLDRGPGGGHLRRRLDRAGRASTRRVARRSQSVCP